MLNLEFFKRKTNITAKVICDSISEQGVRLTTLEIEYPRFIHSELMTHRMLSKNSSSSRAIPVGKMLGQIEENIAEPVYWGKAKKGMQADEEVDYQDLWWYKDIWKYTFEEVSYRVKQLVGEVQEFEPLHKQIPNRLLEPFQMMKVVITGTDWGNFFNLRIHKDAQPEICMLAYKIYKVMEWSKPQKLLQGQYHLPYVCNSYEISEEGFPILDTLAYCTEDNKLLSLEEAIKISAASCASVSYRTEGMTLEKADKIFDMLIKAEVIHSSPFEHLATPIKQPCYITGVNEIHHETWEDGVTHMNKQGQLCSGNLRGFIQYRHLLPNNTNWKFDFEKRIKLFS